jgi:hypothetical protein
MKWCLALVFTVTATTAWAISVPGTSDPWLAGMPSGSTASSGDIAPAQSPVLYPGAVSGGQVLLFSVQGSVNNAPGPSGLTPDGGSFTPHATGAENGIANLTAPINSLIGVFLDAAQPDGSPAPGGLDFSLIGLDFLTLAPALKQPFFIGDGLASGLTPQEFTAPSGATRLFLGTMDGFGWFNNFGAFEVDVRIRPQTVPDMASTASLLGLAVTGCALLRRRLA